MAATGDRINEASPKYIKHPAYSSGFWQDGETLDCGTAIILENNANHLHEESCRQFITCIGPTIDAPQDDNRGFFGFTDVTQPSDFTTAPDESQISWNTRTAYRFGPFNFINDQLAEGSYSVDSFPRKIRILLNLYTDSGNCYGYIYITDSPGKPAPGNYLGKVTFIDSTTGEHTKLVAIEPEITRLMGATFSGYIWIGLRWGASGGECLSISAFEIR